MAGSGVGEADGRTPRALVAARRYLRARVRSAYELRSYLQHRGYPPEVVGRVIARCRADTLLDDRSCARLWADHWARQGYAWSAIHAKLSAKGLEEDAIQHAASRLRIAADDRARARLVAAQGASRSTQRSDVRERARLCEATASRQRSRARLARRLASRGFEPDVIAQVLDDVLGPQTSDHAEC